MADALDRQAAATRVRRLLARQTFPRFEMTFMVSAAGLAGFLASVLLLDFGLDTMSLRYPLAVGVGYAAFLLLLRVWVARWLHGAESGVNPFEWIEATCETTRGEAARVQPDEWGEALPSSTNPDLGLSNAGTAAVEVAGEPFVEATSSAAGGAVDAVAESAWPFLLVVGILSGALIGLGLLVWTAPALLAEILVDAMIAGGLLHRLRGIEPSHWAIGGLRRTWLPAVSLALLLALAGGIMQAWVPEANSIGAFVTAARAA